MKNRIIIFLILAIFFVPAFSYAMVVPMSNLTVIVNTQGSDNSFHFIFTGVGVQSFNLQTQNLSASKTIPILGPYGSYSLSQDNISGLKINSILCTSDNTNDMFWYQSNSIGFSPINKENITCTFNNVKAKNPVLIVPGLLGTEMKKGNDLLWADVLKMVNPLNSDSFMDPLSFNKDLMATDSEVYKNDIIKNPDGLFNYTSDLINEFKNQGYVEGESLFTFPYDWRYGVSGKYSDGKTNVDLLATRIQDVLQQTGADKVDVVAHSLGGLIVKEYAMNHMLDNHIGKAVFVGVPNTGAPKAVKVLLEGDNFGVTGLNDQEMKKISANMPAAYDLLPTQKYYDVKKSYISLVDFTSSNPAEKDLNYQESKSYLNGKGLNQTAVNISDNLHTQAFDDFDLRTAGIDLYAIDGCKAATMTNFLEVKSSSLGSNYNSYGRVEFNAGDGTVPLESATNLPINSGNKYYALVSDHGKMPSEDGIRQEIVNLISGSNLSISSKLISQDINKCNLKGKAISVFSPVNIFVTNQEGDKLGLADDGSIINEIPNADFEILGEHKFIYLPQDDGQVYNINLQGIDAGTFTIKNQDINNSQVVATEVFSNLPVTTNLTGQINISPSDNATTLSLNNSSSPVLPSAVIDSSKSDDVLPPVSAATLTGTAGQSGFYRSDVSVNLKAVDDISGVLNIEYNLDNTGSQKKSGDTAVINVKGEGKHTLTFFSTDKMGNNESEKTLDFIIDKTAPEVVIQFDQSTKDLKFTGTDSVSDASLISVQDKDDTITLTDQAGNTTEIKLKDKNRKILMLAEIKSLKYNGVLANISKNEMAFSWLYDKNKNLKTLSQHIQSKKGYNILAVYDGNRTALLGKDASGIILKSLSGLKIIKITTSKGDLTWSY